MKNPEIPLSARTGLCLLALLMSAGPAPAATEWRIEISAFGNFESARVPASVELDFGREIAVESLRFVDAAENDEPFFFLPEPNSPGRGRLFWMWDRVPPFRPIRFTVSASTGKWRGEPFGDETFGARVAEMSRLVANHGFEDVADGAPVGWELQGSAELSGEHALVGSRSVKIISRAGESGRLQSGFVELKPDTRYQLSFRLKIVERRETEPDRPYHAQQAVAGQLTLRNNEGGGLPRIWRFYQTRGLDEATYLGRWVTVSAAGVTPADTGSGRVEISPLGIDAVFHVDNVLLEEMPAGQPHRVEIGEPTSGQPDSARGR